jgi:excisionase family DNA binding protein
MNKKEAAAYLGVSTRTLEGHAAKGDLSVRYVKGKTGDVADFDESELRKLRAQIESKRATRPAVSRDTPESPEDEPRSLARLSDVRPSEFVAAMAAALDRARERNHIAPQINVGEKIMLSLDDAAALSSLSVNHLREAIRAGKLKGRIIGRGYKIKRTDLDSYVKKL